MITAAFSGKPLVPRCDANVPVSPAHAKYTATSDGHVSLSVLIAVTTVYAWLAPLTLFLPFLVLPDFDILFQRRDTGEPAIFEGVVGGPGTTPSSTPTSASSACNGDGSDFRVGGDQDLDRDAAACPPPGPTGKSGKAGRALTKEELKRLGVIEENLGVLGLTEKDKKQLVMASAIDVNDQRYKQIRQGLIVSRACDQPAN